MPMFNEKTGLGIIGLKTPLDTYSQRNIYTDAFDLKLVCTAGLVCNAQDSQLSEFSIDIFTIFCL